jgi:hypothetical protein
MHCNISWQKNAIKQLRNESVLPAKLLRQSSPWRGRSPRLARRPSTGQCNKLLQKGQMATYHQTNHAVSNQSKLSTSRHMTHTGKTRSTYILVGKMQEMKLGKAFQKR